MPNAYVASPTIAGDLAILATGDGANAAKFWQPPPSTVEPLQQLVTSTMPDTTIAVGDFTRCLWGLRQRPMIELTTTGGDSFSKHQVLIKITWRGAFNVERAGDFHLLTGITT